MRWDPSAAQNGGRAVRACGGGVQGPVRSRGAGARLLPQRQLRGKSSAAASKLLDISLHHTILHCIVLHSTLCYTLFYYTLLHATMFIYCINVTLYHTMLYHIRLYCSMAWPGVSLSQAAPRPPHVCHRQASLLKAVRSGLYRILAKGLLRFMEGVLTMAYMCKRGC